MLMDEAANIAPVRNLASWLSQCGDHGIMIATIWQSIAQIDQRYGRAARDAICAASTAQVFIPPLAEPTSAGYLTELLGEEPVANASARAAGTARSHVEPSEGRRRRRGCARSGVGRAILIYRDLPPAVVRAPGWFEDPRFAGQPAASRSVPSETRWPPAGVRGHVHDVSGKCWPVTAADDRAQPAHTRTLPPDRGRRLRWTARRASGATRAASRTAARPGPRVRI